MLVTTKTCLYILNMNVIYTRLTSKNLTQDLTRKRSLGLYPAARELDTLDIAVVVLLDAMQVCCSANQPNDVRHH